MTAIGLIVAGLGLLVLIAGRLHFMLHLFQLEHYEPARLRVWVQRRGARVDRELLIGCLVAGLALTAAAAAGVLMLEVGVIAGGWLAWRGLRLLRRPQTKPLVFTPRARRLFAAALAIPLLVLVLAAVVVLAGAPAWVAAVIGTATALLGVVTAPELLFAADVAVRPIQELDNRRFVRRARQARGDRPARGRDHRLVREDDHEGVRGRRGRAARPGVRDAGLLQHLPRRRPRHQRGASAPGTAR